MATNTTNNYFSKPAVGGDTDTWGSTLNTNWDTVDSVLAGDTDILALSIVPAAATDVAATFSGLVGIGTTSPTQKLQVDGNIRIGDTAIGVDDDEDYNITTGGQLTIHANDSGENVDYIGLNLSCGNSSGTQNEFSRITCFVNNDEKMRINASGNVGIGTTSPSFKTDINVNSTSANDTQVALRVKSTTTADMTNDFGVSQLFSVEDSSGTNFNIAQLRVVRDGADDSGAFAFSPYSTGTATERMRIDSSGKLLLNTSTHTLTDSEMVVASEYSASGTTTGGITLSSRQSGSWRNSGIFANGANLTFTTGDTGLNGAQASSERMRIDSSGNLLVGTTVANPAGANSVGVGISSGSYGGFIGVTRDGDTPVEINRKTSDGNLITFRKDGTSVGSISNYGADGIVIGKGDTQLALHSDLDAIFPAQGSGLIRDNAIDLGRTTSRFKDIHASGNLVGAIKTHLFNEIYPVGSIFTTTSDSFDPETAFGGTWSLHGGGKVLVGDNNTTTYSVGQTGGSSTHDHTTTVTRDGWGAAGPGLGTVPSGRLITGSGLAEGTEYLSSLRYASGDKDFNSDEETSFPPYIVVKFWMRDTLA